MGRLHITTTTFFLTLAILNAASDSGSELSGAVASVVDIDSASERC